MKKKLTIIALQSKAGIIKRFSINKGIIYCTILLGLCLLAAGIMGIWKYRENISLTNENLLLQAEKDRLEAAARTVEEIRKDEAIIRDFLGLDQQLPPVLEKPAPDVADNPVVQ